MYYVGDLSMRIKYSKLKKLVLNEIKRLNEITYTNAEVSVGAYRYKFNYKIASKEAELTYPIIQISKSGSRSDVNWPSTVGGLKNKITNYIKSKHQTVDSVDF